MASDLRKLGKYCENYCVLAEEILEKVAKDTKKLDPKAGVRTKTDPVFPANSSNVKDNADHFPLSNIDQARNALARSHQYSSVPSWYKGSLKSLQEAVRRKVKAKYPSIEVSEPKKKKSSLEDHEGLIGKYAVWPSEEEVMTEKDYPRNWSDEDWEEYMRRQEEDPFHRLELLDEERNMFLGAPKHEQERIKSLPKHERLKAIQDYMKRERSTF